MRKYYLFFLCSIALLQADDTYHNAITNNNILNFTLSLPQALYDNLRNAYDRVAEESNNIASNAISTIYNVTKNHYYICALGAVGSYYSYINIRLNRLNDFLRQSTCWSLWKRSAALENLFEIPQSELGQELITEIQRRYTRPEHPADFITPMAQFMHDIDVEEKALKEYQFICYYLDRAHLLPYSWYDSLIMEQSQERIKRLGFIKNTFLSWMAEYKLIQQFYKDIAQAAYYRSRNCSLHIDASKLWDTIAQASNLAVKARSMRSV